MYRAQSDPRGICCFSCSRHRFSWALLQGKGSGGQCQPSCWPEGWQGRQGHREVVPGIWCYQDRAGTHLRFSSSLCTDLSMPDKTR